MTLRETFIANLKKYRKENKLSQMNLAELCNTSTSYIGEIETGKKFPSVEMIEKISRNLKIEPSKLFETTMLTKENQNYIEKSEIIKKLNLLIEEINDANIQG